MYLFCTKQYNIYNLVLKAREFSITLDQTLINSLEKKSETETNKFWFRFVYAHAFKFTGFWYPVERVTAVIVPGSPSQRFLLENKGSGPESQPE